MCGSPGRSFIENWRRAEGNLARKSVHAVRNSLRKLVRMKGCCGNYGEPGC